MNQLISIRGVPPLILFLLNVFFFSPFFLHGNIPIDPNPIYQSFPWKALHSSATHDTNQARYFHHIDTTLQILPFKEEARRQILAGKFPLWTNLVFCGAPLLANHIGVFHVFSPLYYLWPGLTGYGAVIVLQLFFAGWFLFWFCEALGCSRFSSLIASIAFMWNGFFLHWIGIVSIDGTLCWTPLILLFVFRLASRNDAVSFAGLVFSLAAQFFGSHSQSWLFNILLFGAFSIFQCLDTAKKRIPYLLKTAAAFLIAISVAAPQLFPFFVAWRNSPRSGGQEFGMYEARNHLSIRKTVTLAVPDLYGQTENNLFSRLLLKPDPEGQGSIWKRVLLGQQGSLYNRTWGYIGLIPLLLAILAVFAGWENWTIRFWATLAFGTLLFLVALGLGPFHQVFSRIWSGFDSLDHTRDIYVFVVAACILSAFGMDRLLERKVPRSFLRLVQLATVCVLAVLVSGVVALQFQKRIVQSGLESQNVQGDSVYSESFLREGIQRIPVMMDQSLPILIPPLGLLLIFSGLTSAWQRNRVPEASLCLLLLVATVSDLYFHGRYDPPLFFASQQDLRPPLKPALENVLQNSQDYRALEIQRKRNDPQLPLEQYSELYAHRNRGNRFFDYAAFDFVARPDSLAICRIPSAGGYLSLYPATIRALWQGRSNDTLQFVRPDEPVDRWSGGWIDLQSIRYILAAPGSNSSVYPKKYDGPELVVFENTRALPRAFLVDAVEKVPNSPAAINKVQKPDFDPAKIVYVEEDIPLALSTSSLQGSAKMIRSQPEDIWIEAQTNKAAMLVLSDTYFPGWKAAMDERPAKIYRADGCFRAVLLPPGSHRIHFYYDPPEFTAALIVSLFGVLVTVITTLISTRTKRAEKGRSPI